MYSLDGLGERMILYSLAYGLIGLILFLLLRKRRRKRTDDAHDPDA